MPNQDEGLSVVLLDFGGTLDADGVAWKERFFRLWHEEGEEITHERFDPAFYAADDAVVGAVAAAASLLETVERIVWGVARGLNVKDPAVVRRVADRFVQEAQASLRAHTRLLSLLSSRYRLGIVSNFYGNLAAVCTEVEIGRYFTVLVDSACVGCVKPDSRIFQAALAGLNVKPDQAVFVGDSLSRDMVGARGIGMPHIWLTPQTVPAEQPCCPDDRVIHRLEDLGRLL